MAKRQWKPVGSSTNWLDGKNWFGGFGGVPQYGDTVVINISGDGLGPSYSGTLSGEQIQIADNGATGSTASRPSMSGSSLTLSGSWISFEGGQQNALNYAALIVQPNSYIWAYNGSDAVLESSLQGYGGASTGTLTNYGQIGANPRSSLEIVGYHNVFNEGNGMYINAASLLIDTNIGFLHNDSGIDVDGGGFLQIEETTFAGSGPVRIESNGTYVAANNHADVFQTVILGDTNVTLDIFGLSTFHPTISGLTTSDRIEVDGQYDGITTVYNFGTKSELVLHGAAGGPGAYIMLAGNYTHSTFSVVPLESDRTTISLVHA